MQESEQMAGVETLFGELRRRWGWLLALGIGLVVLGMIGLSMTLFLTLASVIYFGILILIGGGAQLFHSFTARGWRSIVLSALMGILYVIAGVVVICHPLIASLLLTLALAVVLIGIGILRIGMALHHREFKHWIWLLIGGVLAILLGGMILAQWPVSGLWVIGLFIAIEMILNGWCCITLALTARMAASDSAQPAETA